MVNIIRKQCKRCGKEFNLNQNDPSVLCDQCLEEVNVLWNRIKAMFESRGMTDDEISSLKDNVLDIISEFSPERNEKLIELFEWMLKDIYGKNNS